ncbi:glutamine--fructose-6-phosphate transaminase (isomerizing) [Natronorubrum bangense]|uniref:Glutamine--fructose-6-phosphate aminotransferase [isomerizing] n=2 Tax=Natronorubrum bangense TaxID=61858 RepID=A0A4D6HIA6_9EURY|nr:glutamine--fructose-6-phosphate transaminase (isomerizing) [Natronorubrum bangense]ELY43995.1 glucosamine/fructose-6-phosphate aminotransferase [Natronorubrum bangense JCM 10635]QCC53028.1 glutamine--fructose-6-phosphate transaminase (isomerizing) [Natronorubrum bangense]QCC56279.1 glutamine--fructose-6-phosphate transaminase (isomerizing) [Natronorubrum bangense]
MCGIIGYTGTRRDEALSEVLLNGLSSLEYRGYDSAGVAIANATVSVYKSEGELSELEETLPATTLEGIAGIGHTRWSTHGPPSDTNAHPHTSCNGRVAVVHNGIVENYQELRDALEADGHEFESDTDTEVIPHLIEAALERGDKPETAFRRAISRLEGSYAVAAVVSGDEAVYATRHQSPLVLGIGDDSYFLASDVPAFLEYTDNVVYLEDGQFVSITPSGVEITNGQGSLVDMPVETVEWDIEDAGKSGYDHYMLKEINEQPHALRECLRGRPRELDASIEIDELEGLERPERVHFVACGTSYHAALYGARLFREQGIQTNTFLASEYDVDAIPVDEGTLVVGVTQSGETADTLGALRAANRIGAETLSVTNVVGCSAARETDYVMYIRAGPEIGVAATKTFASQQVALAMLSRALTGACSSAFIKALRALPDQVQSILDTSQAATVADEYVDADAYFFIGRGYNAPVALEGALKMKEITYKHAEGFPAGELKHGPLALVTERTPVFSMLTGDSNAEKMLGNVREVESRGAPIVAVTDVPAQVATHADHVLEIPNTHRLFAPILANIQLQLVSYWVANQLGRSIDKPRNLAKSVTVE